MAQETEIEVKEEIEYQTLAEFLEGNPPNQVVAISDIGKTKQYN